MKRNLTLAHLDTERTWRGGQQQVLSLVEGLSQRGHKNIVIVRSHSALEKICHQRKIPTWSLSPWGEWDFIAAHRLNRFFKKEKFDVIHAHSAHAVGLAAFGAVGLSIPLVATRRVDFPLKNNFFSRWKYNRLTRVLAISSGVKKVLIASGIPEQKIDMVPSGVDFSRFHNIHPITKAELNLPEQAIIIGQVAALAPHKDQKTFLSAIALLRQTQPNVFAVLVGDGFLRNELESLSSQLKISSHVRFVGFREDSLRYLKAFDIFCLSSKEEGLGTSIIDAMALRVPVVATCVGGIPDLIEQGRTGFLAESQKPQLLANALEDMLVLKDKSSLLEQAYQKAMQFDISNTIEKTEAVYNAVVS